ncbi:MAG: AmmeMemoRadiSam system protein B [Candidatus Omnitrophota bacterium]|nr:AmmeMemoRadiSam system protein B [Candidatus Omnitrophota bacterium]
MTKFKCKNRFVIWHLSLGFILSFVLCALSLKGYAAEIKQPNVAGTFYPENAQELSAAIDGYLSAANPPAPGGRLFALIVPHAGYGFSGPTAAFAYKLIQGQAYKTVVILGPSHYYGFSGIALPSAAALRTPLGDAAVDKEFCQKLLRADSAAAIDNAAFEKEHSIEVQLPFLQKTLPGFKIVPLLLGSCTFTECKKLAEALQGIIGSRQDVLVVASSDLYHGYDYEELEQVDSRTLNYLSEMNAEGLYYGLAENKLQLCGGLAVVTALLVSKELGHNKLVVLQHTNSAVVTGKMQKGTWAVGYASCAIDQEEEKPMLNKNQRKRLLEIARSSIDTYLKTGKKLEARETDPQLNQEMGAFVTLHKGGQLRGCIGNLVGRQPLYLTIRDMAVEAAVADPRFPPVEAKELGDLEIEISALSPLQRVDSAEKIQMGSHGVMVKKGFQSGVFLPQVATETGWSKEEFLSQLCAQKAGLSPDAWKDKSTELHIFTAEVFSEKDY